MASTVGMSIFVSDSFLSRTKHVMLQYRHLRWVKSAFFPVFMKNGDAPGSLTRSLRVTSPLWTKTACLAVKGQYLSSAPDSACTTRMHRRMMPCASAPRDFAMG